MIQEMFYQAVKKYIPDRIELPVDSEKLSIRELQRINPRPGGDGVHIPDFWHKVRATLDSNHKKG